LYLMQEPLLSRAKEHVVCQRLKLRRSAHRSVTEPGADFRTRTSQRDKDPKPFASVKTAGEIPGTLAAYCSRISEPGHLTTNVMRDYPPPG
jgi:hypothetical protein